MERPVTASAHQKKVVQYHQLRGCKIGSPALVWPIDHPEIPVGQYGKTSTVQMFDAATGVAETANTRYEPGPIADWADKKVVRYHQLRGCKIGSPALVWPIDHPEIPVGQYGKTSTIQMFDATTGVAETAHTRYEPGPFAEWADRGDEAQPGRTYHNSSLAPLP